MATTDLAVSNSKVDLADAPSRDWGWHTVYPNSARIAGVLMAGLLVFMALIGNHEGHVETIWLTGFAVAIIAVIVFDWWTKRGKWKN